MSLYERFEKLSEVDNPVTTRRRLLGRAAKACLGVAIVATGLAKAETAQAGAELHRSRIRLWQRLHTVGLVLRRFRTPLLVVRRVLRGQRVRRLLLWRTRNRGEQR